MLKILHISDLHLPFLPTLSWKQYVSKTGLGYISWKKRRQHIFLPHILEKLKQAVTSYAPDYILFTGDLVNFGVPQEFEHAYQWLRQFASPEKLLYVPGNHDFYVSYSLEKTLEQLGPYYNAHLRNQTYPFLVDVSEQVSVIGLNTGLPTAFFVARGKIDKPQYERAVRMVTGLKQQNKFIIFMIHHPPLMHQNTWFRGLPNADYENLNALITLASPCIFLHGHNHENTEESLPSLQGRSFVFGTASATAKKHKTKPASSFRCFELHPDNTHSQSLSHVISQLHTFNGDTYDKIEHKHLQLFA